MATFHGKNGAIDVGTDALGELISWSVTETVDTVDDTVMGDSAKTHLVGLPGWSGNATCNWDDTDTNGQEALTIGASVTLHFMAEGDTSTNDDMTGTATVTSVGVTSSVEGKVERSFEFVGNGALTHGAVA